MNNKDFMVLDILNLCGIKAISMESINNIIFERNLLLNQQTYNIVREKIPDIKNIFSSSYFNSLHKNAQNNQKWPLINLVRQILLFYGFNMLPIRKANGYSKDKKKLYKRFFFIQKIIN
jgi:lipopolysaccharide export LptBFGC system permease protein LptF